MRQLHSLLLLFFGACCAQMSNVTWSTIRHFSASLSGLRIAVFWPVAAFAFLVFIVLFLLHGFELAVSARLQTALAANAKILVND